MGRSGSSSIPATRWLTAFSLFLVIYNVFIKPAPVAELSLAEAQSALSSYYDANDTLCEDGEEFDMSTGRCVSQERDVAPNSPKWHGQRKAKTWANSEPIVTDVERSFQLEQHLRALSELDADLKALPAHKDDYMGDRNGGDDDIPTSRDDLAYDGRQVVIAQGDVAPADVRPVAAAVDKEDESESVFAHETVDDALASLRKVIADSAIKADDADIFFPSDAEAAAESDGTDAGSVELVFDGGSPSDADMWVPIATQAAAKSDDSRDDAPHVRTIADAVDDNTEYVDGEPGNDIDTDMESLAPADDSMPEFDEEITMDTTEQVDPVDEDVSIRSP